MIISDDHLRLFQFLAAAVFLVAGLVQAIEDVMFTIDASPLFGKFQTFHWVSVILGYCFTVTTIVSGVVGLISVVISDVRYPRIKIGTFVVWVLSLFLAFGLALANAGIVIYLLVNNSGFHLSFVFSLVYQSGFCLICLLVLVVVVFLEIPLVWSAYKRRRSMLNVSADDYKNAMTLLEDEDESSQRSGSNVVLGRGSGQDLASDDSGYKLLSQ